MKKSSRINIGKYTTAVRICRVHFFFFSTELEHETRLRGENFQINSFRSQKIFSVTVLSSKAQNKNIKMPPTRCVSFVNIFVASHIIELRLFTFLLYDFILNLIGEPKKQKKKLNIYFWVQ